MILFLDVDGVLNCEKSEGWNDGMDVLDPELCNNLADFVQKTNANVVISSTWRLFRDIGWKKLNTWLNERNIFPIDQTPDLSLQEAFSCRGEEIALWLKQNNCNESFIILDDNDDFLEEQKPFHIQTSFEDGFTKEKLAEALLLVEKMQ